MIRITLVAVLAALTFATVAQAGGTDPRKCSSSTPGGTSKHAYWCANYAAVTATRASLAKSQKVARWYPGVFCTQKPSLLRWACVTSLGGATWRLTVTFRATSAGWRTTVARTP